MEYSLRKHQGRALHYTIKQNLKISHSELRLGKSNMLPSNIMQLQLLLFFLIVIGSNAKGCSQPAFAWSPLPSLSANDSIFHGFQLVWEGYLPTEQTPLVYQIDVLKVY